MIFFSTRKSVFFNNFARIQSFRFTKPKLIPVTFSFESGRGGSDPPSVLAGGSGPLPCIPGPPNPTPGWITGWVWKASFQPPDQKPVSSGAAAPPLFSSAAGTLTRSPGLTDPSSHPGPALFCCQWWFSMPAECRCILLEF